MQKKNYELRNEKFRKLVTKQGEPKRGENEKGITLIALIITIIFSYDENLKSSNNKGFLLQSI